MAKELAYKFAGEVVDVEAMLKELDEASFDTAAAQPTQDAGEVGDVAD